MHTKTKTKMVKTPNKKPTQHAEVPKKRRVIRHNFDTKKKCSELQANYKKNMEKAAMCLQDAMRLRIDDALFNIGKFMMATSFKVQDVAGCQLPECWDFQRNYSQMVQGEGEEVFRMQKTSALLCGKGKARVSLISIGRQNKCLGDASVCVSTDMNTSRLHCFVLIDRDSNRVYVIDAGSTGGTTVKQDGFTVKLYGTCSEHHPNIAVVKNEAFTVIVGRSVFNFTQSQDIAKPFVPSIGLQSLRPRKTKKD